ncbi:MAG: peptidoglycan DD-metalloendopeptidase family protein [Kyrpidia sp.]|nr:peptidoglycan DD-metalloendopeptidase family protein [Kyrpidia sp.]
MWRDFVESCRTYLVDEWTAWRSRWRQRSVIRQVRRHLRGRVALTLSAMVPLAAAGVAVVQSHINRAPLAYMVYVNGTYVGSTPDLHSIDRLKDRLSPDATVDVRVVHMALPAFAADQFWRSLAASPAIPKVYAVFVDGKPVVAVATEADAKAAIDRVKALYTPEGGGMDRVAFREKVDFGPIDRLNNLPVRSVDEAVQILEQGTPVKEHYLVSRGDTLWTIAAAHNMSVEQLQDSNPQLTDPNQIQEGDTLNLTAAQPYVHVEAVQQVTREVPIPYDVQYRDDSSLPAGQSKVIQDGQEGRKRQTVRIHYLNGRPVQEEVLGEQILQDKVDQIVAKGTGPAAGYASVNWIWPTTSHMINSPFGEWRGNERHPGVDIGAPYGAPIYASNGGRVIFAGWDSGGYGNCVRIDHGNGIVTIYGHMSQILVSPGQAVAQGQVIGRVGATGQATGPHLHYEVHVGGRVVDPMPYT